MAKKNLSDQISGMIEEIGDPEEVLEKMKGERNKQFPDRNGKGGKKETESAGEDVKKEENKGSAESVAVNEPIKATDKPIKKKSPIAKRNLSVNSLEHLEQLMERDEYRDKKTSFLFALSGKVFDDFEKLSMIYSYKKNSKIGRNEFMRKVLEDFHRNHLAEIIDRLEKS